MNRYIFTSIHFYFRGDVRVEDDEHSSETEASLERGKLDNGLRDIEHIACVNEEELFESDTEAEMRVASREAGKLLRKSSDRPNDFEFERECETVEYSFCVSADLQAVFVRDVTPKRVEILDVAETS